MRIGYIGLGNLGGFLAQGLLRKYGELTVYDVTSENADELVEQGAVQADSVAQVVANSSIVATCLPNPTASKKVLEQMIEAKAGELTWIEMSTNGKDEIIQMAKLANEHGIEVIEAPVTGGVHLARDCQMALLAGGDEQLIKRHAETLLAMSREYHYMGELGNASVIKVLTNLLALTNLVSTSETLMLAKKSGLDLAASYRAIAASSGNSFVHETEGQLILNGSYQIDFTLELALKDLNFARSFMEVTQTNLPLSQQVIALYEKAAELFGKSVQSPQIAKMYEEQENVDLRAEGFPAKLI